MTKKISFIGLFNLSTLRLSSSFLKSIESIKINLKILRNLKTLDLSNNQISYILENDFEFNFMLIEINLNNNFIISLQKNAFLRIGFLKIFKISNNHLNFFNLSLLTNNVYLEELDLNRNNLFFDKINTENLLHNLKVIKLNNVKLIDSDSTFNEKLEMFLKHSQILQLDLSFTDFKQDFRIFDNFFEYIYQG